MRIRWTPPAAADLKIISDYLGQHHPQYRQSTMRKLYQKIRDLKNAPMLADRGGLKERGN